MRTEERKRRDDREARRERRRPYATPTIRSQAVFETTALLCSGKAEGQSLPCQFNMFS